MSNAVKQAIAFAAVFVAGFGACAFLLRQAQNGASHSRNDVFSASASQAAGGRGGLTQAGTSPVADAAARIAPAVVNIDVTGGGTRDAGGPFGFLRPGENEEIEGAGSGIIVSGDGLIVTNNHVVAPIAADEGEGDTSETSGEITVRLADGTEYHDVSIVGRDAQTDLAVLKIGGVHDLPTAELGNSDTLRVGDWAIAVGNPLGFNSTVTLGIVSALNRRDFHNDRDALDHVIQTDASVNPGNSGGALADISGRVVGINTAIASSTGASVGIGFAIPINSARRVIEQLVAKGKVVRPYLGVVYQTVDAIERRGLPPGVSLPHDNDGAVIVNDQNGVPPVAENSPAARAGLLPLDVIREIGGHRVRDIDQIKEEVQKRQVGDKLPLLVWRNGKTFPLTITLQAMPAAYGRRVRTSHLPTGENPYLVPSPHRLR